MFCGKALEMIIAKRAWRLLQKKGGWLGYEEGDDLKGYGVGVEEVFEGNKDYTKKREIWQNKDCDDSFHLL